MDRRDEAVQGAVVCNEVRSWQNPFRVLGAAIKPTNIGMSLAKRTFEGAPRIVDAGHACMSARIASIRVLSLATWHDDGEEAGLSQTVKQEIQRQKRQRQGE